MKRKTSVGSSFDDFLKEEGSLEETHAMAKKRVRRLILRPTVKDLHRAVGAFFKAKDATERCPDLLLSSGISDEAVKIMDTYYQRMFELRVIHGRMKIK